MTIGWGMEPASLHHQATHGRPGTAPSTEVAGEGVAWSRHLQRLDEERLWCLNLQLPLPQLADLQSAPPPPVGRGQGQR